MLGNGRVCISEQILSFATESERAKARVQREGNQKAGGSKGKWKKIKSTHQQKFSTAFKTSQYHL